MATEDPIIAIMQNLFTLQRLGNTIQAEAQPILDALFDAIAEDLVKIDPTGPDLRKWRVLRQDQFIAKVNERLKVAIPKWEAAVRSGLVAAGKQQGKFAQGMLVATTGGGAEIAATPISAARMRAILTQDPFEGQVLKEWAEGLKLDTSRKIRQQVRIGMVREESVPDLVRRIRGTRDPATRQFVGGVYQTTTRNAETIVRTSVNHVSNRALLETYEKNSDVVGWVQFSATIDDRTTIICGSLDGTKWRVGDSAIQVPPLHHNCRSALVPVPDWEALGLKAPEEGPRFARDLTGVDLDKKVSVRRRQGQRGLGRRTEISGSTIYERWLRTAPEAVQNKVLMGKGRADLWRARKYTMAELIRQDGSVIPLSELQ